MSSHEAPHRILIVEDDQRLAELTQEYLIRNGLEVLRGMACERAAVLPTNNLIWSFWT